MKCGKIWSLGSSPSGTTEKDKFTTTNGGTSVKVRGQNDKQQIMNVEELHEKVDTKKDFDLFLEEFLNDYERNSERGIQKVLSRFNLG